MHQRETIGASVVFICMSFYAGHIPVCDSFMQHDCILAVRFYCSGGVLEVYMTGGSDVFSWVENLHARYFFGSGDLSRIFLGIKKTRVFFLGLISERTFRFGFSLRSETIEVFKSCIFLGWKF